MLYSQEQEEGRMQNEELFSRPEAARYLGITSARLSQLTKAGRLGRQVAGRYWVFTKQELDDFKAARDQHPQGGRPKPAAGQLAPARPA